MDTGIRLDSTLTLFLSLYALAAAVCLGLYILNIRHVREHGHEVPDAFTGVVDQNTLTGMRDYTVATSRLGIIEQSAYDILLVLLVLIGVFPWITGAVSSLGMNFIVSGVTFFFLCSLLLGAFEVPFDLYRTFRIEKTFSFSTITARVWLTDLAKSIFVSALLMGVFLSVFFGLITLAPKSWWLWAWGFFVFFQLLVSWLYPVVIAPLFNKFEPIEDEDLMAGIRSLAESSGLSIKGIYKMDAMKRSRHSNAYFTGIGKSKRIVLFDTLLQDHSHDEILSVLAHELGHWKLGHVRKQLILSVIISFVLFYGAYLAVTHEGFYTTFGFQTPAIYAGLFLLTLFFKPAAFLLSPLGAMISRHFERQADDYAFHQVGTSDALVSALKKLATLNLSNLHPHPVYAWFAYSHPPLVERIRRLKSLGGPGEAAPKASQLRKSLPKRP